VTIKKTPTTSSYAGDKKDLCGCGQKAATPAKKARNSKKRLTRDGNTIPFAGAATPDLTGESWPGRR
jgi:hypothetical protein